MFGDAYPTEYVDLPPAYNLVYYVGRFSTPADAVALSKELEKKGWTVLSHNDGSFVEIAGQRDNVVLQTSFDVNTKKVDVLWTVSG